MDWWLLFLLCAGSRQYSARGGLDEWVAPWTQQLSQGSLGRKGEHSTGDEKPVLTKLPPPALAVFRAGRSSNFNFLLRLCQPRNNCGNFIEYLVPALELSAIFCALHGFISNEGEFRLAVSEILKDGHVVCTVYGFMFYS